MNPTEPSKKWPTRRTSTSRYRRFSALTELLISLLRVQRQVSPRTTETKAPEHIGAVAGKYQWDDRPGGDADKDVQGEAITKYCWSEGKKTVSIYLELDGLDDVADDAFKVESGKTNVSLEVQDHSRSQEE